MVEDVQHPTARTPLEGRLRTAAAWTLFSIAAILAIGLIARTPTALRSEYAPPAARRIVVVTIDALRADHLSCYGYTRQTSPNIDRVAAEGVLFESAYANGNWTKPSIASFFTGLWPSETGAIGLWVDPDNPELGQASLSPSVETLSGHLSARGFRTAGFVHNPHLAAELGFGRGFEQYTQGPMACEEIVSRFLNWHEGLDGDTFFSYLHFLEPHAPYDPSEPYGSAFAKDVPAAVIEMGKSEYALWGAYRDEVNHGRTVPAPRVIRGLMDLYDGEVLRSDAAVGTLVETLQARGVYDETLLVIMADHGENFYEHKILAHPTTTFFEPQIRIPLVVKFPESWAIPSGRRTGPVQLIDLTATVAAASGGGRLGRGTNLTGPAAAGVIPEADIATESKAGAVVRFGRLKAYLRFSKGRVGISKLFDVAKSADETVDILSEKPTFASKAVKRIEKWRRFVSGRQGANVIGRAGAVVSERQIEELRALGYLGAASPPPSGNGQ